MKSTLPSSRGGLNLRSASRHAPAAFLSSYAASLPLLERILGQHPGPSPHTTAAVSALANAAAMPDWLSLEDIDVPVRQRHLSLAIDEASHHLLQSSAPTIRSRALALSTSLPHAGDWLNVVPSPSLGLRLQDREFRYSLRYWLGVPLHNCPYPCPECRGTADIFGDHSKALTSNGLASHSPEILQEMLGKHPQAPPPSLPSGPTPASVTLSEAVILKGVKSFPNASAPGPSGLRPSHLKEAVKCPSPDRANLIISRLTRFTNLLAAGQTPLPVTPHLCGATLLASPKSKGGHRPIAVGEVLRRLTSKCLAIVSRSLAFAYLTPLQLGVGVRGGCEAIVHAVSSLMSSSPSSSRWTLQLDFSNAFNNTSRVSMFAQFHQHIPPLAAWMESCYSCQPLLHLGRDSILSCCGVQQGDPLGPLGFALTLQPFIEKIKAEVPGLSLNAWYIDDGTLVGSPEDLDGFRVLALLYVSLSPPDVVVDEEDACSERLDSERPSSKASDHRLAMSPSDHRWRRDFTRRRISRHLSLCPSAGLTSTHLASMKSRDHWLTSAGVLTTDDKQSPRMRAQRSLAPLGTCWRVGM